MKLKILYRKNLNLSQGKLAAQCVHAALGLGCTDFMMPVIVLGVGTAKFEQEKHKHEKDGFIVKDAGVTEVEAGTETCIAFYEINLDK